jgi:hypothetical protein
MKKEHEQFLEVEKLKYDHACDKHQTQGWIMYVGVVLFALYGVSNSYSLFVMGAGLVLGYFIQKHDMKLINSRFSLYLKSMYK